MGKQSNYAPESFDSAAEYDQALVDQLEAYYQDQCMGLYCDPEEFFED